MGGHLILSLNQVYCGGISDGGRETKTKRVFAWTDGVGAMHCDDVSLYDAQVST